MNPANPLLQIHGVPWNIDMNQTPSNLEVDPFSTCLRRNKETRAARQPESVNFGGTFCIRLASNNECRPFSGGIFEKTSQGDYGFDRLSEKDDLFIARRIKKAIFDDSPFVISEGPENLNALDQKPFQITIPDFSSIIFSLILDVLDIRFLCLLFDFFLQPFEKVRDGLVYFSRTVRPKGGNGIRQSRIIEFPSRAERLPHQIPKPGLWTRNRPLFRLRTPPTRSSVRGLASACIRIIWPKEFVNVLEPTQVFPTQLQYQWFVYLSLRKERPPFPIANIFLGSVDDPTADQFVGFTRPTKQP